MRFRASLRWAVLRHRLVQLVADAAFVSIAWFGAFSLRFDNGMPPRYEKLLTETIVLVVVGKLLIFALFRLYQKWWRYIDAHDFQTLVVAVIASSMTLVAGLFVFARDLADPPRIVIALDFLLTLTLVGGSRFFVRSVLEKPLRGFRLPTGREVLLIGAGDGGQMVARELIRNRELGGVPIGFIDDDPRKQGLRFMGLKVLGTTAELSRVLEDAKPDEVVIAIPSAPGIVRERVVSACRQRSIPVRTLPTVFELLRGGVDLMRQVRAVQVEDVLGRDAVVMEVDRVGAYLGGQVVMVTGAGGSIGSELCRQIARVKPRKLILLDHAEDNLFQIRRELTEDRHFGAVEAVLADCKETDRMGAIFDLYKPQFVFHAAAYKHVALMEENAVEAVRNNAVGTRVVAELAAASGCERFVLVSTDKAVKPATVMGASKALAEWAVDAAQERFPKTRYATVRFGNVLGSSGSVVPIFRRQIAAGGPVTVTHPEMSRYFMTIPEAVQLIIRAGDLGTGGETYVLEMGDPVKIMDLARNMIRLAGFEPDIDIPITITGPVPGEKLHEDLFNTDERPQRTVSEKIVHAERQPMFADAVDAVFDDLQQMAAHGDVRRVVEEVRELAATRTTSELRS